VAAVRCKQVSVLRHSCHTARTPLPGRRKDTLPESRPGLRIEVLVQVMDVGSMRATVHEHALNTY
jgi:hypothetical protein